MSAPAGRTVTAILAELLQPRPSRYGRPAWSADSHLATDYIRRVERYGRVPIDHWLEPQPREASRILGWRR